MPVIIDFANCSTPEMREIFEEETRIQRMLDVEGAFAMACAEVGEIPFEDARKIAAMASTKYVVLSRINEIEQETKHDVVALVRALSEVCGTSAKYVHFGVTSSDIVDTAMALQLTDALNLIQKRLNVLEGSLKKEAKQCKTIPLRCRTTSDRLDTTLGPKFEIWMHEISRHIQRLEQCKKRILVGKISGAVGTQASLGPHAMRIQELVMQRLGIKSADISTQIVQRDRHAEFICLLALVASSLERFTIGLLILSKFGKAEFGVLRKRRGTRTIEPCGQNCEEIKLLAGIVRGLVVPALENIVTWNERDLAHSSAERFVIPEACILVDYMVFQLNVLLHDFRAYRSQCLNDDNVNKPSEFKGNNASKRHSYERNKPR